MRTTANVAEILEDQFGVDPVGDAEESTRLDIASLIYNARTRAKLSQSELARRIKSTQSVIARLENADYDGQSLKILSRIAHALNLKLEVRFVAPCDACNAEPLEARNGTNLLKAIEESDWINQKAEEVGNAFVSVAR